MSQWKNQNAIWTAGLPIISPTNWFSSFFCQNHSFHLFLPCRMTESVLYKCLFYKKDKSCVSSEFFKIFVFGKYFVLISTNMVFCTYLNFECICSKSKAFLKLKKKNISNCYHSLFESFQNSTKSLKLKPSYVCMRYEDTIVLLILLSGISSRSEPLWKYKCTQSKKSVPYVLTDMKS
jgi:hypothetical protein